MATSVGRVLVGGIGYMFLRDLSVGPWLARALRALDWPADVEIDELGPGGPIGAVHRFSETSYDRVVIAGAVPRGREPATIEAYRWDARVPPADVVQTAVAEGATGVISLDNLVAVGGHFGVWPRDLVIVEIEPQDTGWGEGFSDEVEAALPRLVDVVHASATGDVSRLPARAVTPGPATGFAGSAPTTIRGGLR